MSRISLVVVCALLTLVGFVFGEGVVAQQEAVAEDTTTRSSGSVVQSAEDRIEGVLDGQLKVPLEYIDQPLLDIVGQLQEDYEIPIQFDTAALDDVAISSDTEVSISVSNIQLRSALDLMLRQPSLQDLTYIIDKEVLLITTQDEADATLLTKVYRVDGFEHFAHSSSESDSHANCYSSLQHVIVNCVEFDSWQENGTGEGIIRLMKPGLLVVSQTRSVHRKIKELLIDLRTVNAEIEGGSGGSGF